MSFTLDVRAFCEKAKKNPETVMRAVSLKLFTAIIKASPVDTGRFRMNWQTTYSTPATGTVNGVDPSGAATINVMSTVVLKHPFWFDFVLTNNLPYANIIEYGGYPGNGPNTVGGYSRQAPQGVVRVNVTRFNTLLNEEAAKVR